MEMKEIRPTEVNENFIKLIGADWMLVTRVDAQDTRGDGQGERAHV